MTFHQENSNFTKWMKIKFADLPSYLHNPLCLCASVFRYRCAGEIQLPNLGLGCLGQDEQQQVCRRVYERAEHITRHRQQNPVQKITKILQRQPDQLHESDHDDEAPADAVEPNQQHTDFFYHLSVDDIFQYEI